MCKRQPHPAVLPEPVPVAQWLTETVSTRAGGFGTMLDEKLQTQDSFQAYQECQLQIIGPAFNIFDAICTPGATEVHAPNICWSCNHEVSF
jgi:hypothetical protein